jgi:hypothetical protein
MKKWKIDKKIYQIATFRVVSISLFLLTTVAMIGFEYYNRNIGTDVRAATVDGCPSSDWVAIGDSCIMDDLLSGSDETWADAVYSCLDDEGARLCTASEWMEACRLTEGGHISVDNMGDDGSNTYYEWVGDIENADDRKAAMIGKAGCGDISSAEIESGSYKRRCCVNRERY